jgi:hypothetical protein
MAEQFGRAYRLTVGRTQIDASTSEGLRIAFSVARDEKRTPNSAEFRVWNLSEAHRAELLSLSTVSVSLEAGYLDDLGQIVLGDLRTVRVVREGANLITVISGGDGEAKLRTARINRTFPAGTSVADVLRGLASALGVQRGNVDFAAVKLATQRLGRARTISGLCYDELEAFCRTQGLKWSVQDSALQIREGDAPVRPTQGPLLRKDSGLLGDVEVEAKAKEKRVSVSGRCALRADLIPGSPVRCEALAFTGNLVINQTTHRGDSHGGDWCVDWVGNPY